MEKQSLFSGRNISDYFLLIFFLPNMLSIGDFFFFTLNFVGSNLLYQPEMLCSGKI